MGAEVVPAVAAVEVGVGGGGLEATQAEANEEEMWVAAEALG